MKKYNTKKLVDFKGVNFVITIVGDVSLPSDDKFFMYGGRKEVKQHWYRNLKASAGSKNMGDLDRIVMGLRQSITYQALVLSNQFNSSNGMSNRELYSKIAPESINARIILRNFNIQYKIAKNQKMKKFKRKGVEYIGLFQKGKRGMVTYSKANKYGKLEDDLDVYTEF